MSRRTTLLIGGLGLVALAIAWMVLRPSGDRVAVDLVEQLPTAKERRPRPETFTVVDASLGGKTERAILTREPSRIKWNVTVPDEAWLKLSLGMLEESWTKPGDGVLFQIGVNVTGTPEYVELLSLVVNPSGNPTDRGWQALVLDMSQFAGDNVDLIFNTYASPPPNTERDRNNDAALWGAPRIVIR